MSSEKTVPILTGKIVRLEPLSEAHIQGLTVAGADEAIWENMRYGMVTTLPKMRAWVLDMLSRKEMVGDIPFAVYHIEMKCVVGATRYMNIDSSARGLEIGGTWYATELQRTGVNTECKYLLLKYAFENLKYIRVQIKTDILNIRSQRSIERFGATKEGILRNHIIRRDGSYRDSVFYSVIESEWPAVKTHLEALQARYTKPKIV